MEELEEYYNTMFDMKISVYKDMVKDGKFKEAMEGLLQLEEQARTCSYTEFTPRVVVAIVQICYEKKNWNALKEYIDNMGNRCRQIKGAVFSMTMECCRFLNEITDETVRMPLIEILRNMINADNEKDTLIRQIMLMHEKNSDTAGTALLLPELLPPDENCVQPNKSVALPEDILAEFGNFKNEINILKEANLDFKKNMVSLQNNVTALEEANAHLQNNVTALEEANANLQAEKMESSFNMLQMTLDKDDLLLRIKALEDFNNFIVSRNIINRRMRGMNANILDISNFFNERFAKKLNEHITLCNAFAHPDGISELFPE